ncbi:MAG: restriction endonuclease subunit S [bacterium]
MTANGWQAIPLGKVLKQVSRDETVNPTQEYRLLGARWYAKGLFIKDVKDGSAIRASRLYRVEKGDFVYNRLFAWKGSFAIATQDDHGCHVSNEFPCFQIQDTILNPDFLRYYMSSSATWDNAFELSSGGTPVSRNRLKAAQLLSMPIPLPDRVEQDRIVAKLDSLSVRIDEARECHRQIEQEAMVMLRSAFSRVVAGATMQKMDKVAPLVRRPTKIRVGEEYPELGIRSFGKGTFHKPALDFAGVGNKRLFGIEPGDLLFSNVFAWEGGIAVAQPGDGGRFGSHRFITCASREGVATSEFLCFYFLTEEGLRKIGAASPGGAGRNRTLGLRKLAEIEVPIPDYGKQIWFNRLQAEVREVLALQQEAAVELDAMLPSVVDRALNGEL